MQLVAYGAQDIYLTGNPQITFFKVVYRRHTNFSMESIEQTFNGSADFGKRVTCTISRNGDLMHKVYLQVTLPKAEGVTWTKWIGHALIKSAEIEIGGQRIDKHYGDWMHIWNELTQTAGHVKGYKKMVGESVTAGEETDLFIPLEFWFCRNPGLALPLIALQYHEVKINLEFRSVAECCSGGSAPSLSAVSLYVDYIYLDTDERRRFAQVSHEYLIEQVQFTGDESASVTNHKSKLNFNHPCKELIWVIQREDATSKTDGPQDWFDYSTASDDNPLISAKLQLNGHDRFSDRSGRYFNLVQPYQNHTNIPESTGINVYSFGLKPEEHQPSGTCNMSRIDNATLNLDIKDTIFTGNKTATIRVYATNYNVLRIMSGMGGLAYSN